MVRRSKILRFSALALIAVALLAIAAYFAALQLLKSRVEQALGAGGEVRTVRVTLTHLEIEGLRVKAAPQLHWPVAEELRAERINIVPDLRSLLTDTIVINSIDIDQAWLPLLRTNKGLFVVPGMRGLNSDNKPADPGRKKEPDEAGAKIRIGKITLHNSDIDFYDATVSRKPHRIPLRKIEAHLNGLALPALEGKSKLVLDARVGEPETGSLHLDGSIALATVDSELTLKLRAFPLRLVEPYLMRATSSHVRSGTLALDLKSSVRNRQLNAQGTLVLDHMELSGNGDIAGLGRQAVLALMRDKRDRIELDFTLKGNLDDPRFSLNEEFYRRIGAALAESLGVGFDTLGKNVGKGLGAVLKGLLGR